MRLLALSNLPWDSCFPPGVGPALGAELRTHLADHVEITTYLESGFRARLEREGVGGSPTNVALAFAGLGGEAEVVGPVAMDAFGARVVADLARHGVGLHRVTPAPERQAHSLAFRAAGGERRFLATMPRTDAGGGPLAAPGAVWDGTGWLVASAYELADPGMRALVVQAFASGRAAGRPLAFDLADPERVRLHAGTIREILTAGVDVLLAGEDCLAALEAVGAAPAGAASWHALAPTVLVSRGRAGLLAAHEGRETAFAAPAVEVVDTTGAGDAFLGAFLYARGVGRAFEPAVRLGLAVAGACLGGLGARVPPERWAALRAAAGD